MNFLDGTVQRAGERITVSTTSGQWPLRGSRFQRLQDGQSVKLAVRPNFVRIPDQIRADDDLVLNGTVELVEVLGAEALITVDCSGERMTALIPANTLPHTGDQVRLALNEHDLHVFDIETQENVSLAVADGAGAAVRAAASPVPDARMHATPGLGVH